MKLKKRNILYSLLIGLAFMSNTSNVSAVTLGEESIGGVTRKTVTGTYHRGTYSAYVKAVEGTASTHAMTISFDDGTTTPAYCAWYENHSPELSGQTKFYAMTSSEFPDNYAAGAASIINTHVSACDNYETKGHWTPCSDCTQSADAACADCVWSDTYSQYSHKLNSSDCSRSVKTTALNIYLTKRQVLAGKTCTSDPNRLDGAIIGAWSRMTALDGIKTDIDAIINYYGPDASGNYKNEYWQAVYTLVKNAMAVDEVYSSPKLTLTSDSESFELDSSGNNYVITYTASATGYGIISNSVKATVTGVSTYTTTAIGDKVIISIPKAIYEAITEEIKVEATAKINFKKLYIFTTLGGINNTDNFRCEFQDLIFALDGLGTDYIEVSTKDIPLPEYKTCYSYDMSCDATECTETNKNNKRTCSSSISTYQAISCDSTDISNNENGKLMFTYGSGCSLYCTEVAEASYPGNVYPKIPLGTNLVWPTANGQGVYPLTTEGKLTCRITGADIGKCISEAQSTNFEYKNSATGTVTYNNLSTDTNVNLKGKCTTTKQFVNSVTLEISNKCNYSLDSEGYNAFDKKTLEAVSVEKERFDKISDKEILLNTESMLPIQGVYKSYFSDLNAVLAGSYKLQISNLSLGHNGQFTSLLNAKEYTCKYGVTDEVSVCNCVCPPGTTHAGKSLESILAQVNDTEQTTCADAVEKYCNTCAYDSCVCYKENGTAVNVESCLNEGKSFATCILENDCSVKKLTCPSNTDLSGLSLGCCLEKGYSYDDCVAKTCYAYCPANSTNFGDSIQTCVNDKATSMDIYDAYDECVAEKCYEPCTGTNCYKPCTGTNCMIYRTISLETPFVGKSAGASKTASTTTNLMNFMHRVSGIDPTVGLALYRLPGANWNSPTLVKNKIWYNRGYKDSEIYQEATPLYTINLDPSSIKQIREYNKTHEYSDFTLSCTDGAYCISKFLRDATFKNADGSDILDRNANASTCANASNKATFISCYKYKVTS